MKTVLIGSRAVYDYFGSSYRDCRNSDYDFLVDLTNEEFNKLKNRRKYISGKRAEFHNVRGCPGLTEFFSKSDKIASPEFLYTLKVTHSFWPIRWHKTMDDVAFFQKIGISLDNDLFKVLYNDWIKIHGEKKAYLDKSNNEFFDDAVNRIYIHDDLHLAVSYYERPLYEKCKTDLSRANLSYNLFISLNPIDQLRLCWEEIYVTALERFLIPQGLKGNPPGAYRGAARLLVTSMTKGWFPLFIVQNWHKLRFPEINYISKFKERIGKCRLIQTN